MLSVVARDSANQGQQYALPSANGGFGSDFTWRCDTCGAYCGAGRSIKTELSRG